MRKFLMISSTICIVTNISAAHADFFDVINKVGKVAETVDKTQALIEGRDVAASDPTAKDTGKHAASHIKHHKK